MKYTEEDSTSTKEIKDFEDILDLVGTKGCRNYAFFFCCSLTSLISALPLFSYQFLGATPEHWCYVDDLAKSNWTELQIRDIAIPYKDSNHHDGYSGCDMYKLNYTSIAFYGYEETKRMIETNELQRNKTISCSVHYFVSHEETIVNKWDLVCDRRSLYSTTQAVNFAGNLFGSLVIGYFNDKYGRAFMYKICVVLYIIAGFAISIAPNIYLYILLRFILTINTSGFYISSFVLSLEMTSKSQRSMVGSFYPLPWAFGIMLTALIAYCFQQWNILQAALTAPALILLAVCWILPESPRWLILNGQHRAALEILKTFAKSNGRTLPSDKKLLDAMKIIECEHTSKETIFEKKTLMENIFHICKRLSFMVRNRQLRFQTLAVFFCWFSAAIVYYGVSLGSSSISTDVYFYILLSGIIEIPSYICLWPAAAYLGRKKSLISFYLISGLSILSVMILVLNDPKDDYSTIRLILFLTGKFAVTAAYQLIWVYTAELYPTNFRSLIIGESSAVARIGSMFSPYINDLLVIKASWSPSALFGGISVLAALVSFYFCETSGKNLPESVEDNSDKDNKD